MGLNSYKDLIVWQKSFRLVTEIYKLTNFFPGPELYGLTSQMRRAAVSIPSNISEGFSRKSRKEFIQFIKIAFSSSSELETQLLIAKELQFLPEKDFKQALLSLEEIRKMLNALSGKLKSL